MTADKPDAPLTQPDLDALIARVYNMTATSISDVTAEAVDTLRSLDAALAAERARADQAEQMIADAWDEGYDVGAGGEYHELGHNPYRSAPTAEQ